MLLRIWHGWTDPDRADAYQRLLEQQIVPGIHERAIPGLRRLEVLRERGPEGPEIGFVTIMTFDDWAAVEAFAGADGTPSVVPDDARRLLSRFDHHSQHYDVIHTCEMDTGATGAA
jgi:hypothetical protein